MSVRFNGTFVFKNVNRIRIRSVEREPDFYDPLILKYTEYSMTNISLSATKSLDSSNTNLEMLEYMRSTESLASVYNVGTLSAPDEERNK